MSHHYASNAAKLLLKSKDSSKVKGVASWGQDDREVPSLPLFLTSIVIAQQCWESILFFCCGEKYDEKDLSLDFLVQDDSINSIWRSFAHRFVLRKAVSPVVSESLPDKAVGNE